ncbi:MAG: glycogen-debranching protein [Chlamydiales bacterium]|nr:glycogen-debranching protein [Chlamydiales bacterium]
MAKKENLHISRGFPSPYGASAHVKGVNFALFSQHATAVSLALFEPDQETPYTEISLDPSVNRTGDVWHIFVNDLPHDHSYGYRIDGPRINGHRFDNSLILLDPYAKSVDPLLPNMTKGKVNPLKPFHWEDDKHPRIPYSDLIIYEMHVKGFNKTFLGIIEKIPYLKSLGVNAIELLPIFTFSTDNLYKNPKTGEQLTNYWGYSTINFFSPMSTYGTILDFKTMVKALHKEGIEVILDVVYNHTAEGNEEGPTYSFRGIANSVYYMLNPEYLNFSGCGNTFNCNHSVVRDFICESLCYWVKEMHVDGFRFDLASILTRRFDGKPIKNPPLIDAISHDPILADTKLIAEPWDPGGLYQVGHFPGKKRWAEWNGQYRDSIRRFIKGTDGEIGTFATRIAGSEDLYGHGRQPTNSINFVTCHDGFTLADLVSYNEKHNEENGEENRDGDSHNNSWNCGVEGETEDANISLLRQRQMRNFHFTLMVSQGVPMVHMGDEYGHSKRGNNNTWSHDSPLNWFQWEKAEGDFPRFFKMMIELRKAHPVLTRAHFLHKRDVTWHGVKPGQPDWSPTSRFLAFTLPDRINNYALYIAINACFKPLEIEIPQGKWKQLVNTALTSPSDIVNEEAAPIVEAAHYTIEAHSALLLKTI